MSQRGRPAPLDIVLGSIGLGLAGLGGALLIGATVMNEHTPGQDGADIGAGLVYLWGLAVLVAAAVMCVLAAVGWLARRVSRRSGG
jgi:hypothetical protein